MKMRGNRGIAGIGSLLCSLTNTVTLSSMSVPAWLAIIAPSPADVVGIAIFTFIVAWIGIAMFGFSLARRESRVNWDRFAGLVVNIIIIVADWYLLGLV